MLCIAHTNIAGVWTWVYGYFKFQVGMAIYFTDGLVDIWIRPHHKSVQLP